MAHLSRASSAKTHITDVLDTYLKDVEQPGNEAFLTEVGSDGEDEKFEDKADSFDLEPVNLVLESEGDDSDTKSQTEELSRCSSSDYETDLETDFEPEPKLEDLNGTELYVKLCEQLGVVPLSCVKSNMQKTHFHMPHRGIGSKGVQALAPPISRSTCARYIDLTNNMIGSDGCSHLSLIVNSNMFITDLNLSYNQLGSRGMTVLCLPIRDSSSLVNVDLSNNEFEDKDAPLLSEIIENNISLRSLNLSKNMFCIEAGKVLGTAIANNDTLEVLDLSWNALRLEGAQAFAKGIAGLFKIKIDKA
ncbi:leucine-rich repeat-containing protein 74A-like [Watersipora subatra]|uniref:leucine-rich repeat-containing protein 74A-like n=1 Tax=Watersipora subatra TaxID=2589382 RepID=UPI00355BD8F4